MYDAFISYGHAADGRLAPELQRGLQRFGKPWFRARALRVFRDEASLSANPHLWTSIQDALDASKHFILLASPAAASSPWVAREAARWRETKPAEKLLVGLTEGELVWDAAAGDFDWRQTTALPETLRGAFSEEPRYIDLRWAREADDLSLSHPRFHDAVAELAAPLHGKPKDELAGEEVRQHRRTVRIARAAVAALVTLTALSIAAGILAVSRAHEARQQRNEARHQLALAQSRQLAAQALLDLPRGHFGDALRSSLAANELASTAEARDSMLRSLDATSGIARFLAGGGNGEALALALSPDGRTLAVGSYAGRVALWDYATGRRLGEPLPGRLGIVRALAFSPDGKTLAAGGFYDDRVVLWNVATRGRLRTPECCSGSGVTSAGFSPDGKSLAVGSSSGLVARWDVAAERWRRPLRGPFHGSVASLAFGAKGRVLAAATSGGWVLSWSPSTRRLLEVSHVTRGLPGLASAAFSPDGALLATGTYEQTVLLWDIRTRRRLVRPLRGRNGGVVSLAFAAGGKELAAGYDDGAVIVWDTVAAQRGQMLPGSTDDLRALAFEADGKTLAAGTLEGALVRWDASTGRRLQATPGSGRAVPFSVGYSTDLRIFAAGNDDGTVTLRSADSLRVLRVAAGDPVADVVVSPDGKTLAAVGQNGTLSLWDVATGRRTRGPQVGQATTVAFSPDGETLAVGNDLAGTVILLDLATGRRRAGALQGPKGINGVGRIAFSPGGERLVVANGDGTFTLWDAASGRLLKRMGPSLGGGEPTSIAFSPDGTTLASANAGGTVILWDLSTGRQLGEPLRGFGGPVNSVAFSPDGTLLAAGTARGARLWRALPLGDDLSAVRARVCGIVGGNLTAERDRRC